MNSLRMVLIILALQLLGSAGVYAAQSMQLEAREG
jgi:hypothetical protein